MDWDTNHGEQNNDRIVLGSQEMKPSDLKSIDQRDQFGKWTNRCLLDPITFIC